MVVVEADVSMKMLCFSLALASVRAAWPVSLYQYGEDWPASALGGPCHCPRFTLLLCGEGIGTGYVSMLFPFVSALKLRTGVPVAVVRALLLSRMSCPLPCYLRLR